LKKYVPGYIYILIYPFKNNTDSDLADSIEASFKFVPNDKCIVIHCERTHCYYVFDTCDEMVAFLTAQKKDNPELLNYHEVIRGQSYQLRFDIEPPTEFLELVLSDFELKAEPAMPKPTGLELINSLEFGLYEENLAEVRHYNEHITNTSLNLASWASPMAATSFLSLARVHFRSFGTTIGIGFLITTPICLHDLLNSIL